MRLRRLLLVGFYLLIQIGCSKAAYAPPDPIADNLKLTRATAPLPNEAFKAVISFAYEPPVRLHAGEEASIHVLVRNVSTLGWPSVGQPDGKYRIELGNRWLDQNGNSRDDGRGPLSYDLEPGDVAEVLLVVTVPDRPGDYVLEFDLVQEEVAWFGGRGSGTLRQSVRVE
jgi:hypothetical protein